MCRLRAPNNSLMLGMVSATTVLVVFAWNVSARALASMLADMYEAREAGYRCGERRIVPCGPTKPILLLLLMIIIILLPKQ